MGSSNTKIIEEFYELHKANPPPELTKETQLLIPSMAEYEDHADTHPEYYIGGRGGSGRSSSSRHSSRSSSNSGISAASIARLIPLGAASFSLTAGVSEQIGSSSDYPKDGYLIADGDVWHALDNVLEPMIKKYPKAKKILKLEFLKLLGVYPTSSSKTNTYLKEGDIRISTALVGFNMQSKPENYEVVDLPNRIRLVKRNGADLVKSGDGGILIVEWGNVITNSDAIIGMGETNALISPVMIFAIILVGLILILLIYTKASEYYIPVVIFQKNN